MKKILLFLLFSFFLFNATSQNLTITYQDDTKKSISGHLKYNKNGFINGIKIISEETTINSPLTKIKTILTDSKKTYHVKLYNQNLFAFEASILNNKLSLFKNNSNYYLDSEAHGFREIPYKTKGDFKYNTLDVGTIIVYVNKCKSSLNYISNNANSITLTKLKSIVKNYNNCELNDEIQVSDKDIEKMNTPKESILFGFTLGQSLLNLNLESAGLDHSENVSPQSIGINVYFRPNILKRKFFYTFSLNYFLKSEFNFISNNNRTIAKFSYVETIFGANYLFLKNKSPINPYIGISGGLLFDNNSYLVTSNNPKLGNTQLIYSINAGLLFKVFKQDLNFNISYLPNTEMDLITSSTLINEKFSYDLSGINLRLTYIF